MQSLLPPVAAAGTTGPDLGPPPQCPDLTEIHQEGRTESPPLTPRWTLTSSLPTICAAPVSSCLPLASRLWPLSRAPWLFGLLHSCCVPVWSWGRPHPAFLETPARPLTGTQLGTGLGGLQVAGGGGTEDNPGSDRESLNPSSTRYFLSVSWLGNSWRELGDPWAAVPGLCGRPGWTILLSRLLG